MTVSVRVDGFHLGQERQAVRHCQIQDLVVDDGQKLLVEVEGLYQ